MELLEESRQRCREMLLEMRLKLVNEVRAARQSKSGSDYLGDLCDCATTLMEAEYAYMLGDRLRQKLHLVERALDAIEDGDYGICEECGESINPKRLLIMPFTLLCVRCQSELERRAKIRGELAA
ncbi:MAG: TraR/DksA C4-type zinc finger protein [Syntrophobacterales bacterium]|jgi:DnaK suppressor protein